MSPQGQQLCVSLPVGSLGKSPVRPARVHSAPRRAQMPVKLQGWAREVSCPREFTGIWGFPRQHLANSQASGLGKRHGGVAKGVRAPTVCFKKNATNRAPRARILVSTLESRSKSHRRFSIFCGKGSRQSSLCSCGLFLVADGGAAHPGRPGPGVLGGPPGENVVKRWKTT